MTRTGEKSFSKESAGQLACCHPAGNFSGFPHCILNKVFCKDKVWDIELSGHVLVSWQVRLQEEADQRIAELAERAQAEAIA